LKYRYRIPNRLEKIPTKIPNTDTDVKYRHRPMTTPDRTWNLSFVFIYDIWKCKSRKNWKRSIFLKL